MYNLGNKNSLYATVGTWSSKTGRKYVAELILINKGFLNPSVQFTMYNNCESLICEAAVFFYLKDPDNQLERKINVLEQSQYIILVKIHFSQN